jgi:hypothetical protein
VEHAQKFFRVGSRRLSCRFFLPNSGVYPPDSVEHVVKEWIDLRIGRAIFVVDCVGNVANKSCADAPLVHATDDHGEQRDDPGDSSASEKSAGIQTENGYAQSPAQAGEHAKPDARECQSGVDAPHA